MVVPGQKQRHYQSPGEHERRGHVVAASADVFANRHGISSRMVRWHIKIHTTVRAKVNPLLTECTEGYISRENVQRSFATWTSGTRKKQRTDAKHREKHKDRPWRIAMRRVVAESPETNWNAEPTQKHPQKDESHPSPNPFVDRHGDQAYQLRRCGGAK